MSDEKLCDLSAVELSKRIQKRAVSPVEVVEAHLDRIERLNGELNAFVTVTGDEAVREARRAEDSLSRRAPLPPLLGVPVAHKDIFFTQGIRTTASSQRLKEFVPGYSASVVERLARAGAISLGKLANSEFSWGGMNPHYASPVNPWGRDRSPGGSSSGSGTAVASFLCAGATGTDTGGSVRIPAAYSGVVGLKPTYGRVSKYGAIPLAWSLDHVGVLARTVEDVAVFLRAMAGHDPKDPTTPGIPVPDYLRDLRSGVKGIRIGISRPHFFEGLEAEVLEAMERAIEVLKAGGALLREVTLPHIEYAYPAELAIIFGEAGAFHDLTVRHEPETLGPGIRKLVQIGQMISAADYLRAQRARRLLVEDFGRALEQTDVLIAPTIPKAAPLIGERSSATPSYTDPQAGWRLTLPFNLTGQPVLSLPCGFDSSGMPLAMQIAGRPWEEAVILRVGHWYETHTEWHKRRPRI